MLSLPQSPTFCPSLTEPRLYVFTKEKDATPFSSQHAIYDPTPPVPEPGFTSSTGPFDGWRVIPFPSPLSFDYVRAPYPIEILTLYGLSALVPLYPKLLSSVQLRSLVLHIIPLPIMYHLSHAFFSRIVPPIIPSSIQTKCVRVNT